ncbi:MAG: biotin-dependent carboxyltransferase family protein, partial [Thermoanaerobaculia bacterium]|nr:biotin-dependent carboxyltransferase family protein [Thermoanaerobaculia bacterium]
MRAGGAAIDVVRPGALTSVQDLGRPGFGAAGVPRGGAADPWAARLANRLVGNADGDALLELTLAGPTLRFDAAATVALVGDPFDSAVDGSAVPFGEPIALAAGAELAIGRALGGARAWLAVAGGVDVPVVLGSRSTDFAGGFGGHEGRALRAGDRLRLSHSMENEPRPRPRERVPADDSSPGGEVLLRLLPGPDESLLVRSAGDPLADAIFAVSPHSDRRGVRLAGAGVPLAPHAPLRSQGTLPGAVQ